jgi:hypothetical protein
MGNWVNVGKVEVESFIGAGVSNCIGSASGAYYSCDSSIVSGSNNKLTGCCSSILGGYNNTVSGNYNTILGGTGNTDSGYSHVGIFGCNVSAVTDKAFHANNFVAQNIPVVSAGSFASLPIGSLYTCSAYPQPYLGRPIYIK